MRDTPLRRSSTIVWGLALMFAVVILGILFSPLFFGQTAELEDDYLEHDGFRAQAKETHKKQAEIKASYEYDREKAAQDFFKKAKQN